MKVLCGRLPTESLMPLSQKEVQPSGRLLEDYTHLIGCKSHGYQFYLHKRMEDTMFACFYDALRDKITQGQAFTCLNNGKRPRAIGNLRASIPSTVRQYNAEYENFDEGSQPHGLTVYKGFLDRELFRTIRNGMVPNLNQNWNNFARRVEAFYTFLAYCRQYDFQIKHWDVYFCQGTFKISQIKEKSTAHKYAVAWDVFKGREDEASAEARNHM